jgi:hypothetical protein
VTSVSDGRVAHVEEVDAEEGQVVAAGQAVQVERVEVPLVADAGDKSPGLQDLSLMPS